MEKILITGGSGFIGSHFNDVLKQEEIINLDLVPPKFASKAAYVQGDIRKREDVERAIGNNQVDMILHLAAMHHDFGIEEREYFDTNETGTQVLTSAAAAYGINNFIFYSSVAVYGNVTEPTTERTATNPSNPYGASKLAGEKVLEEWAAKNNSLKLLIIRPTVVYGPRNLANMYLLIRQIDRGLNISIGKGDNIKSIAYVENLVAATLFLIDKLKNGTVVYNYSDEPQLPSGQIQQIIAKRLGKGSGIKVPLSLAVFMALPFDLMIKLSGKNLSISSMRVKKIATETYHQSPKIIASGFQNKYSTVEGIERMVDWFIEQKRK